MPRVVGIDHLVLSVGNFARSKQFYGKVLGFRLARTVATPSGLLAVHCTFRPTASLPPPPHPSSPRRTGHQLPNFNGQSSGRTLTSSSSELPGVRAASGAGDRPPSYKPLVSGRLVTRACCSDPGW